MDADVFAGLHTQMQMATPASPLDGVFSHVLGFTIVPNFSGGSSSQGSPMRGTGTGPPKAVAPNPNIWTSTDTPSPSD